MAVDDENESEKMESKVTADADASKSKEQDNLGTSSHEETSKDSLKDKKRPENETLVEHDYADQGSSTSTSTSVGPTEMGESEKSPIKNILNITDTPTTVVIKTDSGELRKYRYFFEYDMVL